MEKFETVITDPTIQKIYSFSDIHSDMDSLIIALRDCAKVIVKKPEFAIEEGKIDSNAKELCEIDISDEDGGFIDDLNYMWNPEARNVVVVIIGDIIDGVRNETYKDGMFPSHYKPQIEIKIIRFINNLMLQAKEHNSRLIKLLGNHEIMNMKGDPNASNYLFREDLRMRNYYRGNTRLNTFLLGNHGYKLLMENGNGIFIKINNNMFIHGQIVRNMNLRIYVAINKFLNDPTNNRIINPQTMAPFNYRELMETLNKAKNLYRTDTTDVSPLWERKYGDDTLIDARITNRTGVEFCEKVRETFTNTFIGIPDIDITKLRLVIGHCPQYYSTAYNETNRTFTDVRRNPDGITESVYPPAVTGKFNTSSNIIFGISMECDKTSSGKPNDHYIYRVDVGSSRAFDQVGESQQVRTPTCSGSDDEADCRTNPNPHVYYEKRVLGSRTVQVLEFSGESLDDARIIRSTIKNTRINQPRDYYESTVNRIPQLNLSNDYYRQKYLKYKNKYVSLKKGNIYF